MAVVIRVTSGTASGAVGVVTGGTTGVELDSVVDVVLFSFSSSDTPPMMMVAPGTLSAIFDEACKAAFSVCGSRVTDDLWENDIYRSITHAPFSRVWKHEKKCIKNLITHRLLGDVFLALPRLL